MFRTILSASVLVLAGSVHLRAQSNSFVLKTEPQARFEHLTLEHGLPDHHNDGVWNQEGTAIKVVVSPWWQTWWFRLSCFVAIIAMLLTAHRMIIRRMTSRNVLLQKEIDRRQQIEKALRESEERYRDVVQSQTELICRFLPDGTLTFVNGAYCRYFQRSADELIGHSFWQLIAEEHHQAAKQFLASISPDRPVATIEHTVLAPNGEIRWQQWTDRGFFDERGHLLEFQAVGRDITERKRSEEALRAAVNEIARLKEKLETENVYLRQEMKLSPQSFGEIIGKSPAIKNVLAQVEQVAATDSIVLIQGETGVGKDVLARVIHNLSSRKNQVMVTVNCASLPPSLIESELFGREKGAYTGALTKQVGRFEMADGSTIFLDEIGELSPELQAKLLRVLQDGEFERLGSPNTVKVDVRVIAATNRDLTEQMRLGKFREDLYYRLNVFHIQMPPLRQRKEDIPLLAWTFVEELGEKMGKKVKTIPKRTMEVLQRHPWPGNIRQLRNVIEQAMILSTGETLQIQLPEDSRGGRTVVLTLKHAERQHIIETLEITNWHIKGENGAAKLLGLKPSTLYSKMAKLNIPTIRAKNGKDEISPWGLNVDF